MTTGRRLDRLAERIKEEASQIILYELQDPRMGFVTVMKAKVSADLSQAQVFVSIMGTEADQKRTLAALKHAAGYIQGRIGKQLGIRRYPILRFSLDDTVQRGIRISHLIEQVKREHSTEKGDEPGNGKV